MESFDSGTPYPNLTFPVHGVFPFSKPFIYNETKGNENIRTSGQICIMINQLNDTNSTYLFIDRRKTVRRLGEVYKEIVSNISPNMLIVFVLLGVLKQKPLVDQYQNEDDKSRLEQTWDPKTPTSFCEMNSTIEEAGIEEGAHLTCLVFPPETLLFSGMTPKGISVSASIGKCICVFHSNQKRILAFSNSGLHVFSYMSENLDVEHETFKTYQTLFSTDISEHEAIKKISNLHDIQMMPDGLLIIFSTTTSQEAVLTMYDVYHEDIHEWKRIGVYTLQTPQRSRPTISNDLKQLIVYPELSSMATSLVVYQRQVTDTSDGIQFVQTETLTTPSAVTTQARFSDRGTFITIPQQTKMFHLVGGKFVGIDISSLECATCEDMVVCEKYNILFMACNKEGTSILYIYSMNEDFKSGRITFIPLFVLSNPQHFNVLTLSTTSTKLVITSNHENNHEPRIMTLDISYMVHYHKLIMAYWTQPTAETNIEGLFATADRNLLNILSTSLTRSAVTKLYLPLGDSVNRPDVRTVSFKLDKSKVTTLRYNPEKKVHDIIVE